MINIIIFNNLKSSRIVTSVALAITVYAIFMSSWSLAVCTLLIASAYHWIISTLEISKVKMKETHLVLFDDASVELRSGDEVILRGALKEQQWCTRQAAVLNVSIDGKTLRYAAFSLQQSDKDGFRRLNAWLRHDFCRDPAAVVRVRQLTR